MLNFSVPVSYQYPTSPYTTHTNKTFVDEKMRLDQTKQPTESKIILNLFTEKHGLKLGELNNATGTEGVNTAEEFSNTWIYNPLWIHI